MEVARAALAVDNRSYVIQGNWAIPDDEYGDLSNALDALPAHLKLTAEGKTP
ncbi:hypothetical protein [Azospirillum sp. TSO5]|uniref:hypothetical protein n=1 Tax=Azospirillum sp. TSO5 TaxID=716760 RepID=UPI001304BE0C|nr:hypothetical protein [Azospirillum sp. TSO5]